MSDNGSNGASKLSAQNLWGLLIAAILGGFGGGLGFRQIDPTAWTIEDAKHHDERLRTLEIKISQLPPSSLLIAVNRLEFRLNSIERKLTDLVNWDEKHYNEDHRNRSAQSGGR